MKISIAGIYDRGNLEKERVHLRADSDLDLSFYVLLDTTWITSTEVSAGNHNAFWFPPRVILRGQHVVIYTRVGTTNVETHDDAATYHFLFRGLPNPLYALPNACVTVIEVQTWGSTGVTTAPLPPLPPADISPLLSGLGGLVGPTYDPPAGRGLGFLGQAGLGSTRLGDLLSPNKK